MPSLNLSLPIGATQLAFSDLDADGLVDVIFAAPAQHAGGNATLHIWYAQLLTPFHHRLMGGGASSAPSGGGGASNQTWCVPPPRPVQPLCTPPDFSTLSFFQRRFELPAGGERRRRRRAGRRRQPARGPDTLTRRLPRRLSRRSSAARARPRAGRTEHGGEPGLPLALLHTTTGCVAAERRLEVFNGCVAVGERGEGRIEPRVEAAGEGGGGGGGGGVHGRRSEVYEEEYGEEGAARRRTGRGGSSGGGGSGGGGSSGGGGRRVGQADGRRRPALARAGLPPLGGRSSAAFDLFEDGVWDLIAAYPNGTISAWRQPQGGLDNYFLKVVSTDGACAPAPLDGKLVLPDMPDFLGRLSGGGGTSSSSSSSAAPAAEDDGKGEEEKEAMLRRPRTRRRRSR